MTLCIAAECNEAGDPAIVLCRDWQAQKGAITSDDAYKQRDVDEGDHACRVLISGIPTRADHLLLQCEPAIREFMRKDHVSDTDLDSDRLLQNLRQVTKLIRREYVDNWVAVTLNMEFDDFRKHSRTEFHESHYHEVWDTIKHFDLGAELIITLFDAEGIPVIMRTDGLGEVHYEHDYSIIGTGGEIARAFLCQVDYDPAEMSVGECIYEVLRAKFAAEHSRDVGQGTTVLLTSKGKKDRYLSQKGLDYYDDLLVPYKTPPLQFEASYLELDDDEKAPLKSEPEKPSEEPPSAPPESSSTLETP